MRAGGSISSLPGTLYHLLETDPKRGGFKHNEDTLLVSARPRCEQCRTAREHDTFRPLTRPEVPWNVD